MSMQVISVGTTPNDGTGDTIRDAFGKVKANFEELYRGQFGGPEAKLPIRPLEYFGCIGKGFGETPVDNRDAFLDAIEWSANEGGKLLIGACSYGVDGSLPLLPYLRMQGVSDALSEIRQMHVATSSSTFYADVFVSPDIATEGGTAFTDFSDFIINGGWESLTEYEGQRQPNWTFDPTKMGQRLIVHDTPADGPTHRLLRSFSADSHHRLERMTLKGCAGIPYVQKGRGEIQTKGCKILRAALYGVDTESPDNWWMDNSIFVTGQSAVRIRAGNQRFANCKEWFAGMAKSVETICAGVEVDGPGVNNVIMVNNCTQDTWGPGLYAEGHGLMYHGQIDEAGGGRLGQQGFGFQGTRTQPRTCIRLGALVRSKITASLTGGGRGTQVPSIADIRSSAATANKLDLAVDLDAISPTKVSVSAGNKNAKCFNEVYENGQLISGRVSAANLADAAHGVNKVVPAVAYLDNGDVAFPKPDGAWNVVSPTTTITPA